jgi:carboxymethylenebutenolidase
MLMSLLATPIVAAQQPRGSASAAAVDSDTIRYSSGTAQIETYVARPKTTGKHPAIIVVHDDLGLNDAIRNIAQLFARAGFVAFAPNLASRGTAALPPTSGTMGERTQNRLGLPPAQTVNDLLAAFAYVQQDANVEATKISAVGLGWGGYRVWKMAERLPALHRGVIFYGVTPTEDEITTINTPILGHYAQYDFVLTASVLKTKKQLGQKFTYYVYPTTRGFFGGGSANSALDIAALTGEADIEALQADRKAERTTPTKGDTPPARQALERTLAFLRN